MSYTGAPTNVRSLEQRIRNLEGDDGLALRRRIGMALVVVGQMLPEGAIKDGAAPLWRRDPASLVPLRDSRHHDGHDPCAERAKPPLGACESEAR